MAVETRDPSQWGAGAHPLLAAVTSIEATLDKAVGALAAGTDPGWLSAGEQGVLLEGLARIEQRAAALTLAVLDATDTPDGVASLTGARSPADWLAHRLHVAPRRMGGRARLARRVSAHPVLLTAMLAGEAGLDHARAVVDVVDTIPPIADLPAGADADVHEQAATVLTGLCRAHTPAEVSHLGRRILELVAPDSADELDGARLARAEREAHRRTRLHTRSIGEGLVRISADVPTLHASILEGVVDAIADPTRRQDGHRLSAAQRRGQALCTLLEHLDTRELPQRHGTAVSVAVLVEETRLRADLSAAGLCTTSTGAEVSLGEARRLMCQAGIWPAVMGGGSVVLDAGRGRRFHTGAMRRAMEVAHPTCQAEGCTVPAAWCHGHHRTPWSRGGATTAADGALLCGHHHRRAHDARYDTRWSPSGVATFHLRT